MCTTIMVRVVVKFVDGSVMEFKGDRVTERRDAIVVASGSSTIITFKRNIMFAEVVKEPS